MAVRDTQKLQTLKEVICHQYALLAAVHACVVKGIKEPNRLFFMVYNRSYSDFLAGRKKISDLFQDEREKILQPRCCVYCGSAANLSIDHLFPRNKGGEDVAENLVLACRQCNSSKQDEDMVTWYRSRGQEPPLLLYRRYLKLAVDALKKRGLMELPAHTELPPLPFEVANLYRNDNISVARGRLLTSPVE